MTAPGKSFPEMTKELKDQVYLELVNWWHQTWRLQPFLFDEPNYISPGILIMDSDLSNLASNLHKVSSCERLNVLVQSWESIAPLSSKELESLWEEVQALNNQFSLEMEELNKAKKLKQSKVRKEWESVGNKQGRGNEDDGPTEVKNDMASMTENVAMEHLEVEGPQKRIRTQWGVYEDEQKKLAKLKGKKT